MSKPSTGDPTSTSASASAPAPEPATSNMTVKQRIEEALTLLRKKEQKLVLYGKHGIGKTWMARKLSDLTVTTYNITIWIFLNRKYERIDLFENIVWQLSLFKATEESEIDGEDTEINGEAKKKSGQSTEERLAELEQALTFLSNKKCLIILDGGDKEREDQVMSHLKFLWADSRKYSPKILATRLWGRDYGDESVDCSYFRVEPLLKQDSTNLLEERAKITVSDRLQENILRTSGGIPSAVIAILESLNHVVNSDPGFWTPESAFEELTSQMGGSSFLEADERLLELLCHGYEMAKSTVHGKAVSKCSKHCVDYFRSRSEVNYVDLITNWVMEGFFDPIDRLEEAYKQGHRVLMTLVDGGFLKKQEDNVLVSVGGAKLEKLSDWGRLGFDGEANLGLSSMKQISLGRVIQTEGTIRTYLGARKLGKVSTILADGTRLCREVSDSFFQNMQELKILALFNPRFESLPVSVFETDRILLLAFRGCTLLEKSYHLQKLKSLIVLEISGSSKLRRIPDDLFEHMSGLLSLNLSSSQITSLPPSLSKLVGLRWLVLRGCSRLASLDSLNEFVNLEVLVLSRCSSFKTFSDRVFPGSLGKLRIIDVSWTPIQRLPIFHTMPSLRRLILRGCGSLHVIPKLKLLLALQVIDVRGAVKVRHLKDESFENQKRLRILDLSETEVSRVPSNLGSVSELYLRGCRRIEKLRCSEAMRKLEILDLEDVTMLAEIGDGFFDHLSCLGQLAISKARLRALPCLAGLRSLHRLSIRDCADLEFLPLVKELDKLEVLDASGCTSMKLAKGESFENMSRLKTLNLSGTKLQSLPRLPNPSRLQELLLRSCKDLQDLRESPLFKDLEKLEVLDLSGCTELELGKEESFENMSSLKTLNLSETRVSLLPPLPKPSNLRSLLLKNCTNLTKLPQFESQSNLEELNLSATNVQELSDTGIDFLNHTSQLKILNLSQTSIKQLPQFIVNLKELQELVLSHCSELEQVQELPVSIQVLDLSDTKLSSLPNLSKLTNLKKLLVTDCEKLDFSTVEPNTQLEILGLFGTGTKKFPYKVTESSTRLRRLDLPSLQSLQAIEAVDWSKVNRLPDQVNWEQCGLINEISITTETLSLPAETRALQEAYLRQFNVYLRGEEEEGMDEVYSLVKHLPRGFIEIRGLLNIPQDKTDSKASMVRTIVSEAKIVSLVDHSDTDHEQYVTATKSLHLEHCTETELLPETKPETDQIETLWVSNLPKLLRGVGCFKKMKHLYLDCCPKLRYVFSSSEVAPELETLRIKFCDHLEVIVKDEAEKNLCVLRKLKVLFLLELPEMKRIGSALPESCERRIRECPLLVMEQEPAADKKVINRVLF